MLCSHIIEMQTYARMPDVNLFVENLHEKRYISLKSHLDSRIDQINDNNQIHTSSAERRLLTIQSLGTI